MLTIVLLLFAALVFYTDLKYQSIPNRLTIPAFAAGWAFSLLSGNGIACAVGASIGFFILFVPYLLGWVGGGDIKMLAALGALMGPEPFVPAFVVGVWIAGAFSFLVLLRRRAFGAMVAHMLRLPQGERYRPIAQAIPFGSCMSLSVFIFFVFGQVG